MNSNYRALNEAKKSKARVSAPEIVNNTDTDFLPDPMYTTEENFKKITHHINSNGGTAYDSREAAFAQQKLGTTAPVNLREVTSFTDNMDELATRKFRSAKSLRDKARIIRSRNPGGAARLESQAQLYESQASKYIQRKTHITNKLREQNGLEPIRRDILGSDSAIDTIGTAGRGTGTRIESSIVSGLSNNAMRKSTEELIETFAQISRMNPGRSSDMTRAIANQLIRLPPANQGSMVAQLESQLGASATKNIVKEAKLIRAQFANMPSKYPGLAGLMRSDLNFGKKPPGINWVSVAMTAGSAVLMGHTGVSITLKNVKATDTYWDYVKNVYWHSFWEGTGIGPAFEEAQQDELKEYLKVLQKNPGASAQKHITLTVLKTPYLMGRDVIFGIVYIPDIVWEYFTEEKAMEGYAAMQNQLAANMRQMILDRQDFDKLMADMKKIGLHETDALPFLHCMCDPCGGSLGGFFRPSFKGPGHGPCQCNGPLTIWKTGLRVNDKERQYECFNEVTRMRYDEAQDIFSQWHQKARDENAKSVQEELKEVKQLLETDEHFISATKLFIDIRDLLHPGDIDVVRKMIEPRLSAKADQETQKGNLEKTIEFLELKNRVSGLPDDRTYEMARAKTWQKSWEGAKQVTFPQIADYLNNGLLKKADDKLRILHEWMQPEVNRKESLYPPAYKDPDHVALMKLAKEKKNERAKDIEDTLTRASQYDREKDPGSAVKLLRDLVERWEHTKANRIRIKNQLDRSELLASKAIAADKYGDKLKKEGDLVSAIDAYTMSVSIQKDVHVQQKLDALSEQESLQTDSNKGERRDQPQTAYSDDNKNSGGYWKLVEEKGSIGRECSPSEVYNDYYRDTASGFGSDIVITKMIREGSQVYCQLQAEWQRPPERLDPGRTIELPVTISRLADTGKYFCNMTVSFDMYDMECGGAGAGFDIGDIAFDRNSPSSLQKAIPWNVKEPADKSAGEKLTIRACYNAGATICGENRGMKYYYVWSSGGANTHRVTSDNADEKQDTKPGQVEPGSDSQVANTIAGKWRTSDSNMILFRNGQTFNGTYDLDGGIIIGELKGSVLEGKWSEEGSNTRCETSLNGRYHWGRFRFNFQGDKFTGTWGYCDAEPQSSWTGTKVQSP